MTLPAKTVAIATLLAGAALALPSLGASPAEELGVKGYIASSDYWDFVPSWASLSTGGYTDIWQDLDYMYRGEVKFDIAWVRNGRLCGYAPKKFSGQILTAYYYRELDLETGELLLSKDIDFDNSNLFMMAAYCPEEDLVMGSGVTVDGTPVLMSAPGSDPTAISLVDALGDGDTRNFQSLTWNTADQRFAGINTAGQLVSMDTGGKAQTIGMVADFFDYSPYYTGFCYDASKRIYYWNVTDDSASYLYAVDPSDLSMRKVTEYGDNEIFSFLWCDMKAVAAGAPAAPEFLSADFEGPALSGSLSYRLPEFDNAGQPITGSLGWVATLDGAEWSRGEGTPGQTVTVDYKSLVEGSHKFGLYACWENLEGEETQTEVWIGNDEPKAPVNVAMTTSEVSWSQVTDGSHGGYVDPSAMTYEVSVNGTVMGTTSDTHLSITLDPEQEMQAWRASVTAICNGQRSLPGLSNEIAFGSALDLPLYFRPTEAEFLLMTTADDNGDGFGWHYVGDVTDPDFPCLDSDFSHVEGPADDWLFLPAAKLDDPDAFYYFSMDAKGRKVQMQPYEYFEVKIGREANAASMTETLIPRTLGQVGFVTYDKYFQVPEGGDWFIGIHAVSDFDMYGVRVRDILLSKSAIKGDSPSAPQDVKATPAPEGALSATVQFTMPAADVTGSAYPAGTTLRVRVEADTFEDVTGTPGQTCTATVRTVQGDNKITLTPYCGESIGLPVSVMVYTGIDRPVAPPAISGRVLDDNLGVTLNWEMPREGAQDGYIVPEQCSYQIFVYNGMYGWVLIDEVGAGVTEYTFTVEDEGSMATYRLGVNSVNSAGSSDLLTAYTCVLGTPYSLPFNEEFDSNGPESGPWRATAPEVCTWGFADLAEISYDWDKMPGGALVGMPKTAGTSSIAFPKFTTLANGSKPGGVDLQLTVWAGGGCPQSMQLVLTANQVAEPYRFPVIAKNSGWNTVTYNVPEAFLGLGFVELSLESTFGSTAELCVVDRFEATATSGINETAKTSFAAFGSSGILTVTAPEGSTVTVRTTDGARAAVLTPDSGTAAVMLPQGIYIVTCNGESIKVRL